MQPCLLFFLIFPLSFPFSIILHALGIKRLVRKPTLHASHVPGREDAPLPVRPENNAPVLFYFINGETAHVELTETLLPGVPGGEGSAGSRSRADGWIAPRPALLGTVSARRKP